MRKLLRRLLARLSEWSYLRDEWSYSCYECGQPIHYDDDYDMGGIGEPLREGSILEGLYALSPAETPLLSMLTLSGNTLQNGESAAFVWEDDISP